MLGKEEEDRSETEPVPEEGAGPAGTGWAKRMLRNPDLKVAAYLAVWLASLLGFCYFVTVLNPAQSTVPQPLSTGTFVQSFFYFDGGWFVDIAKYGYTGFSQVRGWDCSYISTAFFPLYPAAIRLVSYPLFGHYYAAALLVSWLSLLGCLIYLRRLALTFRREGDDSDAGFRACLCLLLFPTAFFLAAGYSESIFLLCAAGALYHARRSSWVLSGLWGFLACLARPVGLAVAAAIMLEAARQAGWRPRNLKPRMAALLLAPLGLATYMAYLWWRFSDPLIFTKAEKAGEGWHREFNLVGPYRLVKRLFDSGGVFNPEFAKYLYLLAFMVVMVVMVVLVFRRYGYPLGAFSLLCLLPPLLTSPPDNPMMSLNRLVIVILPAFLLLGEWCRNRDFERFYSIVGTLGLALFSTLFVYGMWAG